uniref:Uncharacterized protein n=1 Tax=Gasterosteus aculeatus TaxID=69293 RepID=G3NQ66_GASAC
ITDSAGNNHVGFVMGKAKLAPRPEQTIPRLELCAAVLGVELADLQLDATTFHSDSKVVLGYISNETRRFYVYVSNRVLRIRRSSRPDQWRYVSTEQNPADHAIRAVTAGRLNDTNWLSGPKYLYTPETSTSESIHELVDPSADSDIRSLVSTLSTTTTSKQLGSQRFARFSSWKSLTRAIIRLIHIACLFNKTLKNSPLFNFEESNQASHIIIRAVKEEAYSQEIKCVQKHEQIPKGSPLKNLDPFIDALGLLRVGGRLHNANLVQSEKTPVIIPGKHQVATLLIKHHHEQIYHQGRLFTEGAVR